jgi:hypothetical protein
MTSMTTDEVLTWLNDQVGEHIHPAVTHPEREPVEREGVLSYEDPRRTCRFDPPLQRRSVSTPSVSVR